MVIRVIVRVIMVIKVSKVIVRVITVEPFGRLGLKSDKGYQAS